MDSILVVLLATVYVLRATPALAQTVQVWSSCLPAKYTPGSAYETNLRGMLKDVVGVVVRSRDGYANDTKGDARGQEAHGLAICYADAPPEVCPLCLDMAAGNVTLACPRAVGAAMIYNNCLLRYANANFLARPDMEQRFSFYNNNMTSAGDADRYSAALRRLMDRLAPAAAASSGRMSSFGQTNITADESLYGFAQCVEDLSTDDCRRCLQSLAASLPMTKGGRAYSLTCYTRFEVVPFYMPPNTTSLVVAPEFSSSAHRRRCFLRWSPEDSIFAATPRTILRNILSNSSQRKKVSLRGLTSVSCAVASWVTTRLGGPVRCLVG